MTLSSITLNWSPLYFVWWWPGAKFKINISSDHHWNFPISSNFLLKIYHGSLRKWIAMKTYVTSLSCVVKQPRCWRIDITECTSWIRSQVVSLKINCCCAVGSLDLNPDCLYDGKSTMVEVMAWCHQAGSRYLNQCWPRPMMPHGITIGLK